MAAMTHDMPEMSATGGRLASGLGLAVLSASSFGLSGSLAGGLMAAGWSSAAAVAVRILLAAVVLVPVAAMQLRGRWSLLRGNLPLVTTYGLVAVAGCQLAYFTAVARIPVGVALLIAGVVALMLHMAIGAALATILQTAVYQYAAEDQVPEGFDADQISRAFAPRTA
jgi:drug/metabolite transporter (DMT)-like permease